MKTGLFFGSFNPVHNGHIEIATFILKNSDLDEIWFVVSPENPWKSGQKKPTSEIRLKMVELAIHNRPGLKATNFEEKLPKPSYTYKSLLYLKKKHPANKFVLLIGGDNLEDFTKWKNYDKILADFEVWAYPRNKKNDADTTLNIKQIEAPLLDFSSTEIRNEIIHNNLKDNRVDNKVLNFIIQNKLYQS
ncbi:nicotinate (nicotinamide) nucleotide adenylyltransferase [Saccharicrinis sp. FJH54]|uniref:nicotinate (nicotinamide) nucleotide adenylyltransferase n=1 Tax=Saccharicrinis sp. FJH54 TaxID=3344665 RepID=UPI0035D46F78